MTYFSRLTDIVTCNLTKLLAEADDPAAALQEIIAEMDAGMAGARRSMQTAQRNEDRIRGEVEEHSAQITHWAGKAKEHLVAGAEGQARLALVRKREVEDLVAGLEQQLVAAEQTREHLSTTFRALEARLAEARRRQQGGADGEESSATDAGAESNSAVSSEIDDELAALKRELGQS
jgi:phage shock protein A